MLVRAPTNPYESFVCHQTAEPMDPLIDRFRVCVFGCVFGALTVLVGPQNVFMCGCGGFLLSHTLPGAVPSAFTGLASRFGMEYWAFPRGYDHRKNISQHEQPPFVYRPHGLRGLVPHASVVTPRSRVCGLVVVCIVVTSKQDSCLSLL